MKKVEENNRIIKEELEKIKELRVTDSDTLQRNNKYFRPVAFDGESKIKRRNIDIIMRHCSTTVNDIYVSSRCNLKAKELHKIDTLVSKSYKKMKITKRENKPVIYVINNFEMQKGAVASYNPVTNVLILDENFAKDIERIKLIQKDGACIDNELSTVVHELFHWIDAQEYQKHFGKITTQKQYNEYIKHLNEKRKKIIEKLGINEYNVTKISEYAVTNFKKNNFDEVYTEYRVLELLKE